MFLLDDEVENAPKEQQMCVKSQIEGQKQKEKMYQNKNLSPNQRQAVFFLDKNKLKKRCQFFSY